MSLTRLLHSCLQNDGGSASHCSQCTCLRAAAGWAAASAVRAAATTAVTVTAVTAVMTAVTAVTAAAARAAMGVAARATATPRALEKQRASDVHSRRSWWCRPQTPCARKRGGRGTGQPCEAQLSLHPNWSPTLHVTCAARRASSSRGRRSPRSAPGLDQLEDPLVRLLGGSVGRRARRRIARHVQSTARPEVRGRMVSQLRTYGKRFPILKGDSPLAAPTRRSPAPTRPRRSHSPPPGSHSPFPTGRLGFLLGRLGPFQNATRLYTRATRSPPGAKLAEPTGHTPGQLAGATRPLGRRLAAGRATTRCGESPGPGPTPRCEMRRATTACSATTACPTTSSAVPSYT
eukprot:scaffold19240_cov53-Phaeocystis_antarctica.AAC.5